MTAADAAWISDAATRSVMDIGSVGKKARPSGGIMGRILVGLATLALAACGTNNAQRDVIRDPDSASRMRVASAAESAGQQDVALSMYAAAASAAPSDAETQARYAAALGRAGMMAEAEQVLARALQQSPREPRFLLALGQLRVRTGAAAEAISMFDQVLVQSPQSVAALNGRGIALDLLGRHAEAQQSYRTAQAVEPANMPAANNLAMSLMLDGRANEAVSILSALRQRSGAPPRVTTNLGLAQAASGDTQGSRTTLAGRVDEEDVGRIVESLRPAGIPISYTVTSEPSAALIASPEAAPVAAPTRRTPPYRPAFASPNSEIAPELPSTPRLVQALPTIPAPEPPLAPIGLRRTDPSSRTESGAGTGTGTAIGA